jgi:outer membrane protein assembly factor BamB
VIKFSGTIVFSGILCAGVAFAEISGWRNDGSGKFPDSEPLVKWSKTEGVIWKKALPKTSNASPTIVNDRVFICQEPETLICLSSADGSNIWEATLEWDALSNGKSRPSKHEANGYSTPTPLSDGKHVYVVFGSGIAAAFDLEGKKIWARIIGRSAHEWGHSASPVFSSGKIIVHMNNKVLALDPKSGKTLWSSPSLSFWGSPLPLELGTRHAILTPGGDIVRAHDGKIVASGVAKMPWTSPIVEDGVVYVVDEKGATAFKLPTRLPLQLKVERLWSTEVKKERYYASAIYLDGLLYNVTQSGFLVVFDASSGETVYEQRLPLSGTVYPSPCLAGKHLIVSSDSGKMVVVEPGRTYKEVAQNMLESLRSCPTFDGNRMYVRTFKHLYCIGPK